MTVTLGDALLPVADAQGLPPDQRDLLKPGELLRGRDDEWHRLPRFFYRVDSWSVALSTQLTPHFGLWELM